MVIGTLNTVTKRFVQGLEELKIRRRIEIIYSTSEIGDNIEKGLADLRRLAVTQTPVRNHWLMLV